MITFEQARNIAVQKLSGWFPPEAKFKVHQYGWENDTEYRLLWAVDASFAAPGDGPYPIVNKTTGAYREEDGPYYEFPNATQVGVWPVVDPGSDHPDPSDEFLTLEDL